MTETPPTPPETDEEAPSEAFAEALAEHEQGGGGAAAAERAAADVEVGKAVKARVVSIGDEHILVDFGGRSEGVVATRGFRAEDGTVKVLEVTVTGRRIDRYRWLPARISGGIPHPSSGSARARAHANWGTLRSCTNLRP